MNISQLSKRGGLSIAIAAVASVATALPTRAAVIFDNTNNLNPSSNGGVLIYGAGSGNLDLSQGFQFTPNAGGTLSQIDVYLDRAQGTGAINFNLYADTANAPNLATSLTNFSFIPSSPTANSARYTANFGAGTNLVANTPYWLIASVAAGSANDFGWNSTDSDPNRRRYQLFTPISGSPSTNLDTGDGGLFRVSVANNTTAVPEPFTVIGTLLGGAAAFRMRKRFKAANNL